MKRSSFIFLVLGLYGCKTLAQQEEMRLTNRLTYKNYAIISIEYGTHGSYRTEVNLLYIYGDRVKIHSVVRNSTIETDTTFVLSGPQLMFIDRFEEDIKKNRIKTSDLIIAGTRTTFEIFINGEQTKLENKVDYSLIKELLLIK